MEISKKQITEKRIITGMNTLNSSTKRPKQFDVSQLLNRPRTKNRSNIKYYVEGIKQSLISSQKSPIRGNRNEDYKPDISLDLNKLFDASEQFLTNLFKPKIVENSARTAETYNKRLNSTMSIKKENDDHKSFKDELQAFDNMIIRYKTHMFQKGPDTGRPISELSMKDNSYISQYNDLTNFKTNRTIYHTNIKNWVKGVHYGGFSTSRRKISTNKSITTENSINNQLEKLINRVKELEQENSELRAFNK